MLDDEIRYRILRALERDPKISQRDLAGVLGVSVGKTNYCLRALVDKGLVKVDNFRKSGNKLAYAYELTPRGLLDKGKVARRFLKRKLQEYERLQSEIEELRLEVVDRSSVTRRLANDP